MTSCRVRAPWVVPVAGPPIADGVVIVGTDGRIAAIGSAGQFGVEEGQSQNFPEAIILPGLVNAHTHLELTGFDELAPEDEFPAWIRRIRALKADRTPAEFLAAARLGVKQCFAGGITTVADTGDSGSVIQALAELGGSGMAYHEVFGPHPDQLKESMAALRDRAGELRAFAGSRVRLGVSPHAPYTVSGPLYSAVTRWSEDMGYPLAVHLAESWAEQQLVVSGDGPFAEAWAARGIPSIRKQALAPAPPRSPVDWLDRLGVLTPQTLCIHAVQVDRKDIACLRSRGVGVAHCPRSNRRHGHGSAPLAELLQSGLRVGVGTDSVASVAPLDLWAELRAAQSLAGQNAEETLRLGTLGAAAAIGLSEEIGSLEPGKWGDLIVIDGGDFPQGALLDRVLETKRQEVQATFVGGREVFRRPARVP